MLTLARLKEVIRYDAKRGTFTWRKRLNNNGPKIGGRAGTKTTWGYIGINIDGRRYFAHRLAWLYVTGEWPRREIDHRRGPSNRWRNLREATRAQNCHNTPRRRDNTSGAKGISYDRARGCWRAYVNKRGRQIWHHRFPSKRAAIAARRNAARRYHGEFARHS